MSSLSFNQNSISNIGGYYKALSLNNEDFVNKFISPEEVSYKGDDNDYEETSNVEEPVDNVPPNSLVSRENTYTENDLENDMKNITYNTEVLNTIENLPSVNSLEHLSKNDVMLGSNKVYKEYPESSSSSDDILSSDEFSDAVSNDTLDLLNDENYY